MVTNAAALIGAAGGITGGVLNTAISAGINAAAASKAHDRQKNMMTRGPTYMMQGLRDAGINPILAAGSGGLGGSAAKISQAHAARGGESAMQGALMGAATAKSIAEANIIRAQQPAADWNAAYNLTPAGRKTLEADRLNKALPTTPWATGARLLFKLLQKPGKPGRLFPPPGHKPYFQSQPPYSVEDNQ